MIELKRLLSKKYDFVCSLGSDCGCAGHLVRKHLRRASYPLDWVGTEALGPERTAQLVADDFAGFLQLENLRKCEKQPTDDQSDKDHEFYADIAQHIIFAHEFPTGRPPEEVYAKVRAKYDRRIARLYETMRQVKSALFVRWSWRESPSEDAILRTAEILRKKFPGRTVDLLAMRNANRPDLDAREIGDGVFLVSGPFHPPGGHPAFGDKAVNDAVFSCIRLRGKWRETLVRRMVRRCVRLLSLFISDRERRHAFREKFDKPDVIQ